MSAGHWWFSVVGPGDGAYSWRVCLDLTGRFCITGLRMCKTEGGPTKRSWGVRAQNLLDRPNFLLWLFWPQTQPFPSTTAYQLIRLQINVSVIWLVPNQLRTDIVSTCQPGCEDDSDSSIEAVLICSLHTTHYSFWAFVTIIIKL